MICVGFSNDLVIMVIENSTLLNDNNPGQSSVNGEPSNPPLRWMVGKGRVHHHLMSLHSIIY